MESHQSSLGWSIPFQTCLKISTLCRNLVALSTKRKHSKILLKTSGQISKELGINGPRDTLYQCCSNHLTVLKIWPPGGITSQYWWNFIFVSEIARKTALLVWNHLLYTGVKNWYRFSHLWKYSTISLHLRKNGTSPSQMTRIRTNSSQSKIRKMWNFSTAQMLDPQNYLNWPYANFTFSKSDVLVPILHTVWNLRNVKLRFNRA